MNCAAANEVDMVQYLSLLGHQPQKINGADYWYLSPLQTEKNASFKVNAIKNKWYDHSLGTGGKTIDFVVKYFKCSVAEALDKIVSFQQQNGLQKLLETLVPSNPRFTLEDVLHVMRKNPDWECLNMHVEQKKT